AAGAEALPRPGAGAAQSEALCPRIARARRSAQDLRASHRAALVRPRVSRYLGHRAALRPGGGRRGAYPSRRERTAAAAALGGSGGEQTGERGGNEGRTGGRADWWTG